MDIFPTRLLNRFLLALACLIVFCLAVASTYFYWRYEQLVSQSAEKEITQITRHLSKFMQLPSDSMPTLATVTDKDKLINEEFFKQAENGDKVLIYLAEGKAILYRPSTRKVIDVAPVRRTDTLSQQEGLAAQPTTTPTPVSEKVAISIYNGSGEAGATTETLGVLEDLSFPYTNGTTRNASQQTYTQTLVVDLDDSHENESTEIADILDGKVGALPAGETPPAEGGILIILGRPRPAETPAPTATPEE